MFSSQCSLALVHHSCTYMHTHAALFSSITITSQARCALCSFSALLASLWPFMFGKSLPQTHTSTNSPTPRTIKKTTFVFALITHYTCKRYMQWVKICEIPCLMMLQMLKVCMTSRGTHGGETQRNHFGFRESWS